MIDIPFVPQPDPKSCALACSVMVAKHFFPNSTFDEIAQVSDWQKGYVVWTYKFWLWIMSKGIRITEYDLIDSEAWAEEGIGGLRDSVSKKEFDYYVNNTKNINSYALDIKRVLLNPNFNYVKIKPTLVNLKTAIDSGNICEIVLDSRSLRKKEGFSLHRVVVLGIEDSNVTFHDPAVGPREKATTGDFENSWLGSVSSPELCIYEG